MMIHKLPKYYYLSKILRSRVSFYSVNCTYMILWMIFHLSIPSIRLSIKSYFYTWPSIIDWSDHYHYQDITSTILDRISSVDNLYRRDWNYSFGFFFQFAIRRRRLLSSSYVISLWSRLFLTILFLDNFEDISYCDLWRYKIIYRINHKGILIYFVSLSWLSNYFMIRVYDSFIDSNFAYDEKIIAITVYFFSKFVHWISNIQEFHEYFSIQSIYFGARTRNHFY